MENQRERDHALAGAGEPAGNSPQNPGEPLPNTSNISFVEELYAEYLQSPERVPERWRRYFRTVADGKQKEEGIRFGPSFRPASIFNPPAAGGDGTALAERREAGALQDRLDQMVRAYRVRGHMVARLDPLGRPRPEQPELDPSHYGFIETDLDRQFSSRTMGGPAVRTLRQVIQTLRNTYCRYIGVQFMHIDDLGIRHWLQDRMESTENRIELGRREQFRIFTRLTDAVIFEEFIQKKFLGAKSFSLEGAETLLPLLDLAIERAGLQGVRGIVLGMAHRGRLNVLAHILGKSPREIFREFEDSDAESYFGSGDVKYHLGHHGEWETASGEKVHVNLCFNPSHLEFINPVVLGRVRAKQDRLGEGGVEQSMALLIHGDAAFAGEGIVQESLNLSELDAYKVGGALHVIVNNQIGFTTDPEEGRSSTYATDVAKMLQSPIFHVNGEYPEAVAQVVRLAMDFRKEFRRDVIIDMYCYRRHGHNESDEPEFTQPLMYAAIKKRKSIQQSYFEHLLELGGITKEEAEQVTRNSRTRLEEELAGAREAERPELRFSALDQVWSEYRGGPDADVPLVDTGFERTRLVAILESLATVPADFRPHRKITRLLERRREMARGEKPVDWTTAEALALGSLALEGTRVRFSGQDTARGTFSQRHAVLHDVTTGRRYTPLQNLSAGLAPVEICNSPLSEAGVLGFEYGYSVACPDGLVLWEAQFGDFCNAAQVIVDQFMTSAEDKWHSLSGLVLLLPHGFEGQGPEHSSARLERFLTLAAKDNIQVVYPTTPAQYFHVLRRQVLRPWRKPLVIMSPKSLLRHPQVASTLDELCTGRFRRILPDERTDPASATRVILCSGKIYYDLHERREELGCRDIVIVRIEQLSPLSDGEIETILAPYPDGTRILWVQEEPENMGAWRHWRARFGYTLFGRWPFCGVFRRASASPATGSAATHKLEQAQIVDIAFGKGRTVPGGADTCCSGHPMCCADCLK
jgi:2-oxoglutarate dehydrogenase E1 component